MILAGWFLPVCVNLLQNVLNDAWRMKIDGFPSDQTLSCEYRSQNVAPLTKVGLFCCSTLNLPVFFIPNLSPSWFSLWAMAELGLCLFFLVVQEEGLCTYCISSTPSHKNKRFLFFAYNLILMFWNLKLLIAVTDLDWKNPDTCTNHFPAVCLDYPGFMCSWKLARVRHTKFFYGTCF